MRHRVAGKQLSRTSSHRKTMRKNMARSLFQHGAIRTTETKAKELRGFVEKLITLARKDTLHARRQVIRELGDQFMADKDGEFLEQSVVQKLFSEIAPRYADRPGGYTRIIRLSERRIGDAGKQVVLQLVEDASAAGGAEGPGSGRRKQRAAKRHQAAEAVEDAAQESQAEAPADEPAAEEQQEAPAAEQAAEDASGEEPRDDQKNSE